MHSVRMGTLGRRPFEHGTKVFGGNEERSDQKTRTMELLNDGFSPSGAFLLITHHDTSCFTYYGLIERR